jgi:hypothetical protein
MFLPVIVVDKNITLPAFTVAGAAFKTTDVLAFTAST